MKIAPGMLVVVVHTDDEDARWLIGQVGTVERELDTFEQMLSNNRWAVDLPNTDAVQCPNCGGYHLGTVWIFADHEIKPLIDPDEAEPRVTEEKLPEELSA